VGGLPVSSSVFIYSRSLSSCCLGLAPQLAGHRVPAGPATGLKDSATSARMPPLARSSRTAKDYSVYRHVPIGVVIPKTSSLLSRRDCAVVAGRPWIEPSRPTGWAFSGAAQPPSAAAQVALARRSAAAQTCLVQARICLGGRMSRHDTQPPDLFPMLSRGKHRSPRTGACFMELASLLAGERWSDHPACTHPLLAAIARHVNDHTSDAGRQRLAELIPSVIGLTGDDLHIDARIALRSATMALPVVAAGRQRVMAVGVLACDRVLAELDGRAVGSLQEQSHLALAEVPQAAEWAYQFTSGVRPSDKGFRRQAAPAIVQDAVEGIAQACVPDPDGMLRDLLVQAIDVCAALVGRDRVGGMVDTAHVRERVPAHGESVPVRLGARRKSI
jgi:hypothetical protein